MNELLLVIFQVIVVIFSVVLHEVSHGIVAYKLGDQTAKLAGRLTLNPISHIDPIGSILVPIITSTFGIVFGWAKPVPYNPNNLKNPKTGGGMIAIAGPLSNIIVAIIFGIILRIILLTPLASTPIVIFLGMIVFINILLAVFNLIPIPPLDGAGVLFSVLPESANALKEFLESYGIFLFFFLIFFAFKFISPIIFSIFYFLVGAPPIF